MGKTSAEDWFMKLLDTDIFIDFLRGLPQAERFILACGDSILFSSITEAELLSGKKCENQREREHVLHLLSQFEKVPVDNPLVQIAGDLRRKYGMEIPDAIIAASAITEQVTLITRNIGDFKRITGLHVERPY